MATRITRRSSLILGAGAGAALFARPAAADWAPSRPVTLVVPWAPGGSTDILARVVAEQLRTPLGQPVVVENRAGASGNTGSDIVAKARPDGHTILFGSMSTHAMNQALFQNMPFDGVRDFTPIARLAFVTNTMVLHPSVPADNVQAFIDYLKGRPGEVPYASAGPGSTNHLCGALFEQMTGTRMIHVPYRGGAPAVTDTVGGRTMMFVTASTQSLPHVRAGRLKLLAVTEGQRSRMLPEIPTVGETVPGYEMAVWYGAFGPPGLPAEITNRFNAEINRALMLPAVRSRMADIGVEVLNETPAEFGRILEADAAKWGRVIRELGIQGE
jgi:tripartite-type tricarboxylate transporter receptor subunit TctC